MWRYASADSPTLGVTIPGATPQAAPANEEALVDTPDQADAEQTDLLPTENAENQAEGVRETDSPLVDFPAPASTEEAFIPPPAVEAQRTAPEKAVSDPFGEADMLTSTPPAEKKKVPNLFQRMTGNSWNRKPEREEAYPMEKREKTSPSSNASAPPRAPEPSPAPVPPTQEGQPVEPIAQQPRLTGVDTQDRASSSQSEDDLLDIPAFLRRQAN